MDDPNDIARIIREYEPEPGYKPFTCSYKFNGSSWSVTIYAKTTEEAEMKLRAVGTGNVDGILQGTIPADGMCPTCKQPWGGTHEIPD